MEMQKATDETAEKNKKERSDCTFDCTLAFWVLRGWLAVRAILAGVEKFGTYKIVQKPLIDPTTGMEDPSGAMVNVKVKYYALTNNVGIPPSLKHQLASEPLVPQFALTTLDHLLGPALIVTGVMLLLGLGTRLSLVLQGLIYIVLTYGLILIRQDDGISWLGIHVALVAMALMLVKYNKFAIFKKW